MKFINNLTIHGFTINPTTHPDILKNIIRGLAGYSEMHLCDYVENELPRKTHKNYLGKIIGEPNVVEIKNDEKVGLIGHCFIDNGYFNIRVWNNIYPSQIYFELFLEDEILDADLIIDHLSAPAIPNDGLGMFDYTYSISKKILPSSTLEKFSKLESSYHVNDPILLDGENWEIELNKLKEMECYFCKAEPNSWIFVKNDKGPHTSFRATLVCQDHKRLGRLGETEGINPEHLFINQNEKNKNMLSSKNMKKFTFNTFFDKTNNYQITENLPEE